MRRAEVFFQDKRAGILEEIHRGTAYRFTYDEDYAGLPVSLTMPTSRRVYEYDRFPPFFEGLLPEGFMLEAMLRLTKIDRNDLFSQLVTVGADLVGAATVKELK